MDSVFGEPGPAFSRKGLPQPVAKGGKSALARFSIYGFFSKNYPSRIDPRKHLLNIDFVKIEPGSRLLFIGDSVTDCDRARPVGAGSHAALGHGYVAVVDSALAAGDVSPAIRISNMGISGNTIRDLSSRWDTDVLALRPDWLSVMIGINDVWRQFDGVDASAAVMPDEFERVYDRLISRTLPRLKGLVILSPYYVQAARTDPLRSRMDEYGAIAKRVAGRHGAIFVDVQAALDKALASTDYAAIAGDRVHPTPLGHRLLAGALLGAIGFIVRWRKNPAV